MCAQVAVQVDALCATGLSITTGPFCLRNRESTGLPHKEAFGPLA